MKSAKGRGTGGKDGFLQCLPSISFRSLCEGGNRRVGTCGWGGRCASRAARLQGRKQNVLSRGEGLVFVGQGPGRGLRS